MTESLRNQLQDFKASYLKRVREYAATEQAEMQKRYDSFKAMKGSVDNEYWAMEKRVHREWSLRIMPLEKFEARKVAEGEKHFEASLIKLTQRIINKGINPEAAKVNVNFLDPNLNCEIEEGDKKVHAYTIIAGGPVQRPHYRYLVK